MKKKEENKQQGEGSGPGWEVVYSGFVLILLCFFIMLSSFASVEQSNVMRFVRSFVDAVSIFSGGYKFDRGSEVLNRSPDVIDKSSPMAKIYQDLMTYLANVGLEREVGLRFSGNRIVMTLSDFVLFSSGEADISEEGYPFLAHCASILKDYTCRVRIEGHTDNVPIHNDRYPSNWELSAARAVNVLRYFTEKAGLPPERFSAVGFGAWHPVCDNNTPANRARNRRVEIVLTAREEQQENNP